MIKPAARTSVCTATQPCKFRRVRLEMQCAALLGILLGGCGETGNSDEATSSDGETTTSGNASSSGPIATSSMTSTSSVGTSGSSSAASTRSSDDSSSGDSQVTASQDDTATSGVSSSGDGSSQTTATAEGDAGVPSSEADASTADASVGGDDGSMSFFVTSTGVAEGGNFGGLEGADAFCTQLAAAVSEDLGNKTWRAYLSTSSVNARDRIGNGPWRNAEGVIVANDVTELHAQEPGEALDATWPPADLSIALTETGEQVPNSIHDILTGSLPDGTVDADRHCVDWTSSETTAEASVGHSNRDGGGRPPYFNATHQVGCAPGEANYEDGTVTAGGGQGAIYCFAL